MPEKKYLLEGWLIPEEVGIIVINDYAVARISMIPNDNTEASTEQFNESYYSYDEEEDDLNDYLIMMSDLKFEKEIDRLRKLVPNHSIPWLEVE